MPCYCDIPDADDQKEIQRRAKTTMYFDATAILTKEQIANNKIGVVPYPDPNTALCNLCKILTEEQMKSIPANLYFQIKWPYKTLYEWHLKHVQDDENN